MEFSWNLPCLALQVWEQEAWELYISVTLAPNRTFCSLSLKNCFFFSNKKSSQLQKMRLGEAMPTLAQIALVCTRCDFYWFPLQITELPPGTVVPNHHQSSELKALKFCPRPWGQDQSSYHQVRIKMSFDLCFFTMAEQNFILCHFWLLVHA